MLRHGGASWPAALLAALGAAAFVAWRSVPGVGFGFAALAGAAALSWPASAGCFVTLTAALPWALALEGFGLLTVVAVALARDPRRVSRRLLGAFLASTGIGLLGVALCGGPTAALGSGLVAAALAYRLGAVPVFAWVPMLLRHPARRIAALGGVGVVVAAAVLARALPLLPDPAAAGTTLSALSVVTIPWAARGAWRQRTSDPPCARTYLVVIAFAAVLVAVGLGVRGRS